MPHSFQSICKERKILSAIFCVFNIQLFSSCKMHFTAKDYFPRGVLNYIFFISLTCYNFHVCNLWGLDLFYFFSQAQSRFLVCSKVPSPHYKFQQKVHVESGASIIMEQQVQKFTFIKDYFKRILSNHSRFRPTSSCMSVPDFSHAI